MVAIELAFSCAMEHREYRLTTGEDVVRYQHVGAPAGSPDEGVP